MAHTTTVRLLAPRPNEQCQNYQAKNLYPDFKCDAIGVCKNCDHGEKGCHAMGVAAGANNFTRYYVHEYGRINSTDPKANARQMVAEIGARGPISGSICVTAAFEAYSGGIFEDTTNCTSLDHSISITGYGTDPSSGKDYWIGRNSWGARGAAMLARACDACQGVQWLPGRRPPARLYCAPAHIGAFSSLSIGHLPPLAPAPPQRPALRSLA